MFSLFKSKPKRAPYAYHTYMTDMEKYWMLMEDLKGISTDQQIMLIHYFDDTGEELKKLMEASNIRFRENELVLDEQIKVTLWSFKRALQQPFSKENKVICAEVFPTRAATFQLLESQTEVSEIIFYASMDSPFFELFGSDRIKSLMQNLGIAKNEKIQHRMIDKSIERAQMKLEENARNPSIFSSFEDWLAANPKT